MTRALLILTALMAPLGLAACNTTQGFGQDVEVVGEEIQEATQ